jgi:type II secretory pathway pseudopilin PulG
VRDFLSRTIHNRSYVLDLLVAFLLVTTIYFLVGQKNQTEQLARVADYNKLINTQNKQILDRIISCTDTNGECNVENQQKTSIVIANINKVSLLASYCAKTTPANATLSTFQKCVEDQLKIK